MVLSRRALVRLFAGIIVALILLSFAGQVLKFQFGYPNVFGLVTLFDVNHENNVPTWYQSIALLLGATLLSLLAVAARRSRAPFAAHWLALAVIFLFLSMDEVGSLHERAGEALSRLLGRPSGVWASTWTVFGAAAVVGIGTAFFRFMLHLAWRERIQVAAAGGLFVGGALGMEMIIALFYSEPLSQESLSFAAMVNFEELLEKLGVIVFLDFLLRRAASTASFKLVVAD